MYDNCDDDSLGSDREHSPEDYFQEPTQKNPAMSKITEVSEALNLDENSNLQAIRGIITEVYERAPGKGGPEFKVTLADWNARRLIIKVNLWGCDVCLTKNSVNRGIIITPGDGPKSGIQCKTGNSYKNAKTGITIQGKFECHASGCGVAFVADGNTAAPEPSSPLSTKSTSFEPHTHSQGQPAQQNNAPDDAVGRFNYEMAQHAAALRRCFDASHAILEDFAAAHAAATIKFSASDHKEVAVTLFIATTGYQQPNAVIRGLPVTFFGKTPPKVAAQPPPPAAAKPQLAPETPDELPY